jgi:hypothetical protein
MTTPASDGISQATVPDSNNFGMGRKRLFTGAVCASHLCMSADIEAR